LWGISAHPSSKIIIWDNPLGELYQKSGKELTPIDEVRAGVMFCHEHSRCADQTFSIPADPAPHFQGSPGPEFTAQQAACSAFQLRRTHI
jgi:hypothetical protein